MEGKATKKKMQELDNETLKHRNVNRGVDQGETGHR